MNNSENNKNYTQRSSAQSNSTGSAGVPRQYLSANRTQNPTGTVGTPQESAARHQLTQSARTQNTAQAPRQAQSRPSAASSSVGRLTAEERRRMEAARLAAMSSVKRTSTAEINDFETEIPQKNKQSTAAVHTVQRTTPRRYEEEPRALPYRKKKRVSINWGAILFVLIIIAVIGISIWQITKNPKDPNPSGDPDSSIVGGDESDSQNTENPTEEPNTEPDETEPPEDIPLVMYETQIHLNKYIDYGYQILVNGSAEFKRVDEVEMTNVYANRTGILKVSGTGVGMEEKAFRALEAMNAEFIKQTGCDDLILTSGYRNIDDQQRIWNNNIAQNGEDYTRRYVALPGYSEHHTGLACDLSFYTDDGATIPVADHEFGSWFWENCSDYGYILRYLKDKEEITKTAYEPWHFRYVGYPHAKAVEQFGACYEEYIEKLKDYTFDTKMLFVSTDGVASEVKPEEMPTSDGYLIYYVPMDEGESTAIKIPSGFEYKELEISGNNVDGFIVTITLYESAN